MRNYTHSQTRHSQARFERPSPDAPVRDDAPDGRTYTDRLESRGMSPEDERIAKEAGGGED